ncbi:hypothetical protein LTS10_005214 [Elasticomyces elasticus]|nr:hypothetical protein LTS10_005214 [Elasticomyces elasticus]
MHSLIRKVAACLCFIFCAVWWGHTYFYRDPGSVFFDKTRAYEQRYSQYRKAETEQAIDQYSSLEPEDGHGKAGPNATLCIGISSVKRQHSQYLETTVGSILHGLTAEERADLFVSVLIAETDPQEHPSWSQDGWMSKAVDDMHTYNVSAQEKQYLQDLEETASFSEKGIYDYVHALRQCYETGTPYIGIFEDDIMLAEGWLIRTLLGIQQIPPSDPTQWLFMRLFNQERSTGWASRSIGGNNEHWISIAIGLCITVPVLLLRRQWPWARTHLDLGTLGVVALILNPALVVFFFQSGKASLLPPSPGVFNEPFGCCSQAMIFPRTEVSSLMEYLQAKKQGQVDLLLNDLAVEGGLTRYALYPVQAQHIGLDSSRMTEAQEAQAIWSMAYEDLDPVALERYHQRMTKEYYGSLV